MGIRKFEVIPPESEEKIGEGLAPGELVCRISREKAREVGEKNRDKLVIAADTMVFLDGKALGKPSGGEEAKKMLSLLSGTMHEVYTGVTVLLGGVEITRFEAAKVYFKALEEETIKAYIETGEPMDKAGAYGAQGIGASLIEKIDGDVSAVVGLPLFLLSEMLREAGVNMLEIGEEP